jgi:hypothetical protein
LDIGVERHVRTLTYNQNRHPASMTNHRSTPIS